MNTNYEKIVKKINADTYNEFMEYIRYLFRYSNNGAVHIIHKYTADHIPDIMKKKVEDLTDEDKINLLIHWAYEHGGEDRYKETPFSIIQKITDAELVQEFNRRATAFGSSVAIKAEAIVVRKE